ncbi:HEPN domain-containing protein [Leptospira andrefontaineae]|uniref:Uncharacterized protein n=1 Tax=Leptospira andrefontaineae TaxID=2484976 RepID=A0A4R9H6P2_9LEPT|nr:HEPN domain-containing protein [Leptospira andrefontaineae]TGK41279.1 hypothetical protein EHO65_07585 [Leptospira andrefontaineae]
MDEIVENALACTAEDIHEILSDLARKDRLLSTIDRRWEKSDREYYVRRDIQLIVWPIVFHQIQEEISQLDSYQKAEKLILSDAKIKDQLNTVVGTEEFFSHQVTFEGVMRKTLIPFLGENSLLEFDYEIALSQIRSIARDFEADYITVEEIAPLFGFRAEAESLQLDDDLTIEKLKPKEISILLNSGIHLSIQSPHSDIVLVVYEFGIVRRKRYKKQIGPRSFPVTRNTETKISWEELIITSLQLFKAGTVSSAGKIVNYTGLFKSSYLLQHTSSRPNVNSEYNLKNGEEGRAIDLWRRLNLVSINLPNFLVVALSRYSQSVLKSAYEDKIIDLMIAAEAIFLQSESDVNGELNYRLSHRAALFLEQDPNKQREIYRFFKSAYSMRSKIVHGSTLEIKKGQMSLNECVDLLNRYISYSIEKIVDLMRQQKNTKFKVDWDNITFPSR